MGLADFLVVDLNIILNLNVYVQLVIDDVGGQLAKHVFERYIFLKARLHIEFQEWLSHPDTCEI